QGEGDFGVFGGAFHPGFGGDGGGAGRKVHHRGDLQPRAAVVAQGKVGRRHQDEVHVAVQPAVDGEVGPRGGDRVRAGVADRHGQLVVLLQVVGQVHPEGGVPARVFGQLFAVQVDFGGHGGALELQPGPAALGQFGLVQVPQVPALAAVVIVAAVLAVLGVP